MNGEPQKEWDCQESAGDCIDYSAGLTVAEMEKALGLDKCKPIHITSSDAEDMMSKDWDLMDKWYEEDLRALYNRVMAAGKKKE